MPLCKTNMYEPICRAYMRAYIYIYTSSAQWGSHKLWMTVCKTKKLGSYKAVKQLLKLTDSCYQLDNYMITLSDKYSYR